LDAVFALVLILVLLRAGYDGESCGKAGDC
jgi:hypothetical protein